MTAHDWAVLAVIALLLVLVAVSGGPDDEDPDDEYRDLREWMNERRRDKD